MIAFMNGAFCDDAAASVHAADRGLTLGDGVFDTLLAVDGTPQDGRAHFERLRRHAAVMGIAIDTAGWEETAAALLARNGFTAGRHAVRTTVTRGPGTRGLAVPAAPLPAVIMRAAPAPAPALSCRVIIARHMRRNEGSPLSRIKSLNYGDNIMAWREAAATGADDAIMLNNAGNVACATAANVFICVDGAWLTPPLADGAMDGVVRARLLDDGFAHEGTITGAMLARCDDILLTSSVAGKRPATLMEYPQE
jgi:branched-chain amino acid aminotransferase